MAKAKKKSSRRSAKRAKPMQVVSLQSALHMVKQAERRIAARGRPERRNPDNDFESENPLRHFPKLPGRGRPPKVRLYEMVTRLKNGMVAEKKFKATKDQAYARVRRIMTKKFHGSPVVEIMLDDGK